MYQAKKSDKKLVIHIITTMFKQNPGVNWMFSSKNDTTKNIQNLANYAFTKCYRKNGVFLSSNYKGVAMMIEQNNTRFSIIDFFYQLKFALTNIPVNKLKDVLQRESYRNKIRPNHKPYYYFWFLGVLKNGENAAFEFHKELTQLAQKNKLPIYLETTLKRNELIYKKMGFETYHYWKDDQKNIEFWFMRKNVSL